MIRYINSLVERLQEVLSALGIESNPALKVAIFLMLKDISEEGDRLQNRIDTLEREETDHHRKIDELRDCLVAHQNEIVQLRKEVADKEKEAVKKLLKPVKIRMNEQTLIRYNSGVDRLGYIKRIRDVTHLHIGEAKSIVDKMEKGDFVDLMVNPDRLTAEFWAAFDFETL